MQGRTSVHETVWGIEVWGAMATIDKEVLGGRCTADKEKKLKTTHTTGAGAGACSAELGDLLLLHLFLGQTYRDGGGDGSATEAKVWRDGSGDLDAGRDMAGSVVLSSSLRLLGAGLGGRRRSSWCGDGSRSGAGE